MSTNTSETSPLLQDTERVEHQTSEAPSIEGAAWKHTIRRRKRSLIFGAVAVGLTVFLVVAIATNVRPFPPSTRPGGGIGNEDEYGLLGDDPRLSKYLTPSDAQYCADWKDSERIVSDGVSLSSASFTLPASSGLLFFVSRGQSTNGNFRLLSERSSGHDIAVEVTATYHEQSRLDKTKACYAVNANEHGILLHTRSDENRKGEEPIFNITVQLPDIQEFGDLSTDFSNGVYNHEIGSFFDLWRPTSFGELHIKAKNAPVLVEAMITPSSFVETSNASIEGIFLVADEVHLRTENAPITSIIWALGQRPGAEVKTSVRTKNAAITAFMTMASDFERIKLISEFHTSNGALNISMPHTAGMLADQCILDIEGSTNNASTSVFLAPDYDGYYTLETTEGLAKARIQWDPTLRDPDGKGRKRTMENDVDEPWKKEGKMYWGDSLPKPASSIRVTTTKEDAWLYTNYEIVSQLEFLTL